ncbi:MAG: D-tyrosyl-tRNA(Tyr) deacylase [Fibrobacter sp.]|jgi:D-tyrosyl-tRNA(Tyr) deacylase|uniref:D-aminoacyl-tRNA deacylase n=1 Tax=Fibrobacter sp. UWP2 TaxID=1896216 RepID=UPI000916C494|nr:D-aminoacyl-tRNA deacylase [Fibrobacter sp. UWP2]MBO7383748.1 D-tyrosyl-tRNA(Tyr) deacylase [Fibrobacter sp.]MCR5378784.1 D-tyrosyl-tRNA(Tyr) deacylase [Fibrobacter sp.]SHI31813.1 D-tyrosyl-tRNA(Tyr) deacylase [Fibrobacter sp. UWP2]
MKFLIQRVTKAQVDIDGQTVGKIDGKGFLVLIGVGEGDTKEVADRMIRKMIALRIFADENGKTNLSIIDVKGSLLLVSQFTLYADCHKGNRPTFNNAGNPALAEELYNYIVAECKKEVAVVETGKFGADMQVSLVNDGPFTIMLE